MGSALSPFNSFQIIQGLETLSLRIKKHCKNALKVKEFLETSDKIEKVILAGAFGTHISPKHAMVLGMIPDCSLDKVSSSGNAAGTGARIALLNYEMRIEIEKQVKKIEKVETAIEPKFQEFFVAASNIPNGVDKFPQLTKKVNLPSVAFNLKQRPERRSRKLK